MTAASATRTGMILALAMATPALARAPVGEIRSRTTGLPAVAVAGSQNAEAVLDEGRALLAGGNPADAISAFRAALAQAPQSVAALNGIAVAYDRLGRHDLAREHFELALAIEPEAADIAYNLGLSLVRAGQDRAAIPHLQRAAQSSDARLGNAARRTLTLIASRLTAPSAPQPAFAAPAVLAAAPAPTARIDMASSGEAVLVLPTAAPAARPPVQRLAAAPVPAPQPAAPLAPATAPDPAVAARLGDVAALTIPLALPEPAPATPADEDAPEPPAPQRTAAAAVPPAPKAPPAPPPALPPALAVAEPPRSPVLPAARVMLLAERPEDPQAIADQPDPLPPAPADDRAAIRLAIARLESLIERIEQSRA